MSFFNNTVKTKRLTFIVEYSGYKTDCFDKHKMGQSFAHHLRQTLQDKAVVNDGWKISIEDKK